jgi:beta-glucanase (GH16 family)
MKNLIDPRKLAACILLIGMLVGLAACAQPTPTAIPTPTLIPNTATPQPTETPVPTPTLVNWNLIWSDEFNSPDGSPVDDSLWEHQTGGSGWGNPELEYYTDRIENSFIENPDGKNGVLVIKAIKEDYKGLQYTSARLTTRKKFEPMFGRFEIRAQIPYGQGIWPALWMMGNNGTWPYCGEMDIMENIGKEPNIVHSTIHGPGYSGAKGIGKPYSLPDGANFSEDYHLYAIEWEPNIIRFYVDDQLYNTVTPADLPQGTKWVFDHPFYLLMNVAVGGGWPGYPNDTTVFPQTMKVDYVRAYERPGGWPTLIPEPSSTPKP